MIILMFASIVAMLPNSVLFPAEHVLATHLHHSLAFIGWMVTAYAIAYIGSTPILGILSDFLGRKFVLMVGLCLFAIGGGVPLFTTNSTLILLGRFVMGVGSAGIQPMVDSMIGDIYEPGPARRRAFAVFAAAIAVAEAMMPFLGGFVGTFWWKGVFLLYGSALVVAVFCFRLASQRRSGAEPEPMSFWAYRDSLRVAAKIPELSATFLGAMIFGTVYFGVSAMLPIALIGTHTPLQNGILFLPIGFFWVLGAFGFTRIPHIRRLGGMASGAILLLAVATLLLGYVHSWLLLLGVGSLWGIGSAVSTTLFTWVVGDESPDAVRGAMNGIYNAAYVLGFSIGAPLFIGLVNRIGLRHATWVGALCMAALAPVFLLAYRPRGKHASTPTTPSSVM